MEHFPEKVTKSQNICALRFNGYDYEQASGIAEQDATGGGLSKLITPVIETLTLHEAEEKNFAAFFGLQRYLFKWGGEYLTKYSEKHIAFDFLFLHLYRLDPPAEFSDENYVLQWNQDFRPSAETIAAYVRRTFRRRGRGKKCTI